MKLTQKQRPTPGPWHVDALKPGDILIGETARHSIRGPDDERRYSEFAFDVDEANARLIAAAPTMLSLLKEWLHSAYPQLIVDQERVSRTLDLIKRIEGAN